MNDCERIFALHLCEPASSWSVGEFGVLAEFHHAGPVVHSGLLARTPGGAIRVRPHPQARILAYETPSPNPRLWNHGVAFCLPENEARMACRTGVTELGPDTEAICEASRREVLFDLGLARRSVDFCVRTADPALLEKLRAALGASILERPDLNAAIVAAGPARVVESRMARVEITNPIPPPGGVSPNGPHTHLMPDLAKRGRTHDANIPVPAGFLPCLTLYPAHPARDPEGREREFDAGMHSAYQRLLEQFGDREYVAAKRSSAPPRNRKESLGQLIAARQSALASKIHSDPI